MSDIPTVTYYAYSGTQYIGQYSGEDSAVLAFIAGKGWTTGPKPLATDRDLWVSIVADATAAQAAAAASASEAAAVAAARFDDIADLAASDALTDGEYYTASSAFNGEPETFLYDADSTATADGALIVDATGMGAGRLVSTRTVFALRSEFFADLRLFDAGEIMTSNGLSWEATDSVTDIQNAGGQYYIALPTASGKYYPEHYGAPRNGVDDDAPAIDLAVKNHETVGAGLGTYLMKTPVRERTNGGGRRIVGANKVHTIFKASDDWATGMTDLNGNDYTITVIDGDSFSLNGVDSTGFAAYADGGVCIKRGQQASFVVVDNATQAATCVITAPQHGYTTGDEIRIEYMSGPPMFWFGNSNGHGNYRLDFEHVKLDGNHRAIGLRLHESGTSSVDLCYIINCVVGIDAPGIIGTSIGRCEMATNSMHIFMTDPALSGSAVDEDSTSETESPLTLNTNINLIWGNWVSGGKQAMVVSGGLCALRDNTLQGVGDDLALSQIVLDSANESLGYGGGPELTNNWSEGGTYKAEVEITNTRKVKINGGGQYGTSARTFEQSILADDQSSGLVVTGVSFLYLGNATPAEGRSQNAVIYTDAKHTTLIANHYAQASTYTYAQLVKLNRTTTANNIILEAGQNGGTPMGVEFGNIQMDIGSIATIQKNTNTVGAFNAAIDGFSPRTSFLPETNSGANLGSTTKQFANGYLSGRLYVDAVAVVNSQQAAIADATDAASAITQLNDLLAKLRTHGLIAT